MPPHQPVPTTATEMGFIVYLRKLVTVTIFRF
jgi:hypothetical protein